MAKTARLDPRLMREARRTGTALTASILLGLVSAWAVIAQALCLTRIVNGVSFRHLPLAVLTPWIVALLALFLVRAGLAYGAEITGFHAAASIKTALREKLLASLFAQGPLAGTSSAEAAATLLEGVEALEPYFSRYMPQMALCLAVPLAILAVVFPLDLWSGLILLVAGPLIPLFMILVGYRAEAINQRQWEKLLRLGAHFLDVLQGLTTLKLFGRARDEIAIARKISEDYRRTTMAGLRVAFLTSAVLEFFASLAIALIAVLFGARLIHGHFDFAPAFLVLLLAPEYFVPLRGLSVHYHARMSAIAAARQIFGVLDAAPPPLPAATLRQTESLDIVCESLTFAYGGAPVLNGLGAHFPPATLTAIVGESGAGKTTLARLLLGFARPASGAITVNGQNLAEIAQASWWEQLAWVPQTPRLFHGTIAENLRLGRPQATLDELRAACRQAAALPFIEALPAQFDTKIGDSGAGLSGGQIQRLALARAWLKDPRLLILDEATASLDAATEAEIIETIMQFAKTRTVIVIAHRLKLAERADRVLVLEDGCIAQAGPAAKLRAEPGPYRRLIAAWETESCVS